MSIHLKDNFKQGDPFYASDINNISSAINKLSLKIDNIPLNETTNYDIVISQIKKELQVINNTVLKLEDSINNAKKDISKNKISNDDNIQNIISQIDELKTSIVENQTSNNNVIQNIISQIDELKTSIAANQNYMSNIEYTEANAENSTNENGVFGYKAMDIYAYSKKSITLYPYCNVNIYDTIERELEFVAGAGSNNTLVNDYIVTFPAGNNCKITFSPNFGKLKWENDKKPTYISGYTYEIHISNGLASFKKYK